MVIHDPGLSGSDKAFEVFVKPLQIYFSVLSAHTAERFIPQTFGLFLSSDRVVSLERKLFTKNIGKAVS